MITLELLQHLAIEQLNSEPENYDGGSITIPKDEDELHDFLLSARIGNTRIEEDDTLYEEMCNILKNKDNCEKLMDTIETEYDSLNYDPWREHCDADFYGV